MEEQLMALLLGDAALSALVGDRIHWGRMPQGTDAMPYITMWKQPGVTSYTYAGFSGYVQQRIQVDLYGLKYGSTVLASRAAFRLLSGYRGGDIQMIEAEIAGSEPEETAGGTTRLYRNRMDIIVHYRFQ